MENDVYMVLDTPPTSPVQVSSLNNSNNNKFNENNIQLDGKFYFYNNKKTLNFIYFFFFNRRF
jgi:hypothetical protein